MTARVSVALGSVWVKRWPDGDERIVACVAKRSDEAWEFLILHDTTDSVWVAGRSFGMGVDFLAANYRSVA